MTSITHTTQQRDRYEALFENSSDAILILSGGRFVDCNRAAIEMLRSKDKASVLQTHPSELSPEYQPDGRLSFEKADEMIAIAIERGTHRFEWDHKRMDGEVFPVEVLLTCIPMGDDIEIHTVWRDVSERKALEKRLRHAQKLEVIGKLSSGFAHEFNNYLVPIIGYPPRPTCHCLITLRKPVSGPLRWSTNWPYSARKMNDSFQYSIYRKPLNSTLG
jgi:PAS domain S-box-containing protein